MGVLLALGSAALYGVADFAGGLLSRRAGFAVVALLGQAGGLVLMATVAPVLPGEPTGAGLLWGGLSGVGTGLGMVFLYRGLSRGAMSVVVPVSAVGGLAIPVLVGIALLGDRPTVLAVTGMVLAVPALWLVSHRGRTESAGSLDALLASLGIALQYLALAQASPDAGLWPVLAGRVTATLAVLPIAWRSVARTRAAERDPTSTASRNATSTAGRGHASTRRHGSVITARRVGPGTILGAVAVGGCATLALVAYLLATREQLLSIAVVLSSLYPAIPVLLGLTVLRERLNRAQLTGLVAAGVAIALLTLG
ncbi:MAG: EamA family transporter [Actinophytocola sp.]|uniref:EamA family transporter n=1 Tax=Actinophytocola sp. TaxID=1872138 RepID=UPI003D6C385D